MDKGKYKVIGLMSGTSLDGLDIAFSHYTLSRGKWKFELIDAESISYDATLKMRLRNACNLPSDQLLVLDKEYGSWLGKMLQIYLSARRFKPDFVASHGHTVFHQPYNGFTLQIGSGQHIANTCQLPVISDFRSKDVSLGGQGAPLVPIGDKMLFREYKYCMNLGGIANVSFEDNKEGRVSFDICPANMLLNYLATKAGKQYDHGGKLAEEGQIADSVLHSMNQLEYYSKDHPKSLGYEWFRKEMIPLLDRNEVTVNDLLRTSVEHIAQQINQAIPAKKRAKILVTGGGVHNDFLITRFQEIFGDNAQIIIPEKEIIDFKEAIVFGFLGVLRWRNENNCLQSVTGASKDSSGGIIYQP